MFSQLVARFLPFNCAAQYWFTNCNLEFFSLEDIFMPKDFLFIDQHDFYYTSGKEVIDDIHTFLAQMDARGVNWLLCVPDNYAVRELFSNYYFNQIHIHCKELNQKRPLVFITNYPVKFNF